ncbi:unnamed protein product [Penicillium viridicatum]
MHRIATLLFTKVLFSQLRTTAATAATAASSGSGKTRVVWTSSALAELGSSIDGINFDLLTNERRTALRITGHPKRAPGSSVGNLLVDTLRMESRHVRLEQDYPERCDLRRVHGTLCWTLTLETTGSYTIPWGRIHPNEATPRQDLIKAGHNKEKGVLDYGNKFWDWCEGKWRGYI